ncbi:MAG: diaminopimelate epimerase [Candidatus Dasytiphilus stammeri]
MKFSKMHSLGNDFMIVESITQNIIVSHSVIRRMADRRQGIGFDQFLLVETPKNDHTDFHYRIFNCDGNEVTQCGNGARCLAKFVNLKGLTNKKNLRVSTKKGKLFLVIEDNEQICVKMNEPNFTPARIPFLADTIHNKYPIVVGDDTIMCSVVSMGNPHCVIPVDNIKNAPVQKVGCILEKHSLFPESVNISFMEVITRQHIRLRVFERGVGETPACGSGACAAVAVGVKRGFLNEEVQVDLPGGSLQIGWLGPGESLFMTGPATHVYDGIISDLQ